MIAAGAAGSIVEENIQARDDGMVVGRERFELSVSAMSKQCPNQLDYRPCAAAAGGRY